MKTPDRIITPGIIVVSVLVIFILIVFNSFAQYKTERGSITVDGAILNYVAEGSGTPCLVIGSSVYYPRTFSENLKKSLKMYFVDMRWFVKDNEKTQTDQITVQTIADDIELIRKKLKLSRFVLIGHSIHGNVALDYARRYPAHVSQVVVIGSPAIYGSKEATDAMLTFRNGAASERMDVLKKNWEINSETISKLSPSEAFVKTHVTNGPLYWYDYTYDCSELWKGVEVNTEVINQLFQKLYVNYDVSASATILSQPVHVMLGKHDYVVPYTAWKSANSNIPKMKLTLFEKSGHTPQLEGI